MSAVWTWGCREGDGQEWRENSARRSAHGGQVGIDRREETAGSAPACSFSLQIVYPPAAADFPVTMVPPSRAVLLDNSLHLAKSNFFNNKMGITKNLPTSKGCYEISESNTFGTRAAEMIV